MTILLYILVVVFGFYSFQNLPLALMPSMEVPAAVVYATYPGAGPEDIEQQVTKKLEGAVAGLSGLDTLQSTSSENMAMLVIRFTNDTDMDQAMTDLRDKVSQVKSQLPDAASDPTVMSIDIDSMPGVAVALRGPYDLAGLPESVWTLAAFEYTEQSIRAVARVLRGEAEPTGRLPVTL